MEYTKDDKKDMEDDLFLMLDAASRIYSTDDYRRIKTTWARISRILNKEVSMGTTTIKTIEIQVTAEQLNQIRHKAVEQGITINKFAYEAIREKMEK